MINIIAQIFFWIFIVLAVLNTYLFFVFRSFENDNISPTCYFFALVYDVILLLLGKKINPTLTTYVIAISGVLVHIMTFQIIENTYSTGLDWQELKKRFEPLYIALWFFDIFLIFLHMKMYTIFYAFIFAISGMDHLKTVMEYKKEPNKSEKKIRRIQYYSYFSIYHFVLTFLFLIF